MARVSRHVRQNDSFEVTISEVPHDCWPLFIERLNVWCQQIPHDWLDPIPISPLMARVVHAAPMVRLALESVKLYPHIVSVEMVRGLPLLEISHSRYFLQPEEETDNWMLVKKSISETRMKHVILLCHTLPEVAQHLAMLIVGDLVIEAFERRGIISPEK